MAKTYTGRDGSLLVNGTTQIKVSNWSLQGELELLETTTLGDCKRSFTPGMQTFTGNASLLYYKDLDGRNDASTFLRTVIKTGRVTDNDKVQLTLRLSDSGVNNDVTLDAFITSVSIGATVGEISRAEISFQANGMPVAVTI